MWSSSFFFRAFALSDPFFNNIHLKSSWLQMKEDEARQLPVKARALLTDPQIYRRLQATCALATVSPLGWGTQKCGNEHDEQKLCVFV